jgi:hypothetical protein
LTKVGTAAFTFPVGGDGVYAPLGIDAVASATTFKAKYIAGDPDPSYSRSAKDTTIGFLNRCGYWSIDRTTGSQNAVPTLGWSHNPCYSTAPVDASIALWDGSTWKDKGNAAYSGTRFNGLAKSNSAISNYPVILSLAGDCNFVGLSYFSKPLIEAGDTIILKSIPENQKLYSYFISDSLAQQSTSNSFEKTGLNEGDIVKTVTISIDGCEFHSLNKVHKKSGNTCSIEMDQSSALSGNGVSYGIGTCGCGGTTITQNFTQTQNGQVSNGPLTERQRIQAYDLRTDVTYNPKPYNTPEKTISFNIVVLEDFHNYTPHGGNFSSYYDLVLESALKMAEEQFSGGTDSQQLNNGPHPDGMIPPSDPILDPAAESSGAKIKFKLNKIIHIDNASIHSTIWSDFGGSNSILRDKIKEQDCNYQQSINLVLGEQREVDSDVWGNAGTPSCSIAEGYVFSQGTIKHTFEEVNVYQPLIDLLQIYPNPDEVDFVTIQNVLLQTLDWEIHRLAGHWAHEIGHTLDLFHVYDGNNDGIHNNLQFPCCPETDIIDHFDFLSDVFDLNDPNGNSSFCNPNPGLICYHQNIGPNGCDGIAFQNDLEIDGLPNPCHIYGTNNIMGNFNIRFGYISPLQVAKIQRALSLKSVRKYVVGSPYDPTPIEITENETWGMDIQVYNDIVVKSGNTLKVTCRILFPDQAKLVVEPGAVLYLEGDGAILTGFHEMWQGVKLLGDANAAQGTISLSSGVPNLDVDGYPIVSSSQGVVIINGGTIENAEEGIFVGAGFGDLEYGKTGGIIYAKDATFRNNYRSVALNPYKRNSISQFIDCHFICDNHLKNPAYYNDFSDTWKGSQSFVSLWGVKTIRFIDCKFENDINYFLAGECPGEGYSRAFDYNNRTDAVGSYDSRYYFISTDPDNPTTPKRNEFIGLSRGVHARHSFPDPVNLISCNNALFDNVQYGIITENSNASWITNNTFLVPNGVGPFENSAIDPYGVLVNTYKSQRITGNKFFAENTSGSLFNYGLVLRGLNNFSSSARVTNNEFDEVTQSIVAMINAPSVFIDCNEFSNATKEWVLFPNNEPGFITNDRMFQDQGTGCQSIQVRRGNKFYDSGNHIWSRANNSWNYFSRGSVPNENPTFFYNSGGSPFPCTGGQYADPCASGGGDDDDHIHAIHQYRVQVKAEYNSVIQAIDNLSFDGGNTVARMAELADTTITNDSLVTSFKNASPLSDSVLINTYSGIRNFTTNQLLDISERNLPCSKVVHDSLISYLNSNGRFSGIYDTLAVKLQSFNPNYSTKETLRRESSELKATWNYFVDAAVAYYSDKDSLEALIPLFKDSLANEGFEKELISAYVSLDSLSQAESTLDSLVITSVDDSLFVSYTELFISMKSDSISWLEIDSSAVQILEAISRTPSIVQPYALAARAIRGDTIYHFHPAIDDGISARIAGNQQLTFLPEQGVEEIKIYPNPSQGIFTVDMNNLLEGNYLLQVTDISGRLMISRKVNVIDTQFSDRLNMQEFADGLYFCNVIGPDFIKKQSFKIIVSK